MHFIVYLSVVLAPFFSRTDSLQASVGRQVNPSNIDNDVPIANQPTNATIYIASVCSSTGYFCVEKCSKLILCTDKGGEISASTVVTCPTGKGSFCNETSKDCSSWLCSDLGIDQESYFLCTAPGIYPHPFDCSKYLECPKTLPASPSIKTCPQDNGYFDASVTKCQNDKNIEQCQKSPIPKCDFAGQYGSVPGNSSMFYICNVRDTGYIVPDIYSCRNYSYVFNQETATCDYSSASALTISFTMLTVSLLYALLQPGVKC